MATRVSTSCDGCALRKVRCEAKRPCSECTSRSLVCTSFRMQKKRGPKGMKPATARKVQDAQRRLRKQQEEQQQEQKQLPDFQQQFVETPGCKHDSPTESGSGLDTSVTNKDQSSPYASSSSENPELYSPVDNFQTPALPQKLSLATYREILELFDERLYPVWPVVSAEDLMAKIDLDENDYESWALAASLCAATIAQLRLQEHTESWDPSLSQSFSSSAQRFRELYDYRESYSVSSLLIPFFLHIYFANTGKLRTAGVYLRESITYVHGLSLDQPESYLALDNSERSFRLRLFWLVFISERTYCAENGFPTVLVPIGELPPIEDRDSDKGRITQAFASLTQIFAHLRGDILDASAWRVSTLDSGNIVASQSDLAVEKHTLVSSEIQQVDIFVTQQWMRLLLWEYTMRHFTMSLQSEEHAFSLLLPITIAHKLLSLLSSVTAESIYAHGYGMELKVYRVADVLMDLLACAPDKVREHGMWVGLESILYSLKDLLLDVGGYRSVFLDKLHTRMATSELSDRMWPYVSIPSTLDKEIWRTCGTVESEPNSQELPEL